MYKIDYHDPRYPESLRQISMPPKQLYCMGNIELLNKERKISIVGTRSATPYGRRCCEQLVETLVEADVVTVSGLALGIDAICHQKTLDCHGQTIAVVACGLDEIYPKRNEALWNRIAKEGLIISEYPPGTKAFSVHFPERNRIIVALSRALVVVESKSKGGSLISASIALDENRDVYAIPGDVDSLCSEGCNALIRDSQAKLLAKAEEILYDYAWAKKEKGSMALSYQNISPLGRKILEHLKGEKSLEDLERETKLSRSVLLSELMNLELESFVKSMSGGKFKKVK